MLPDPKIRCPATGFTKSCRSIVSKYDCPKFVHIAGTNPNDGQQVDKFGCIDSFLHMLLIENSQMQRQTGAAVESLRNEVVNKPHPFETLSNLLQNGQESLKLVNPKNNDND